MSDLVIGFATNTSESSLQIFVQSLRRVYSTTECDLVLITNRFEPYFARLSELGVKFVPTPNNYSKETGAVSKLINRIALHGLRRLGPKMNRTAPEITASYPTLIETWHHPHFARWFAYERFLDLNRHYDQVLLSDVKDVVFQAPFFHYSDQDKACLCDQGLKYGETYHDTEWYRQAFGDKELKKVLGQSPLCIGTMMGPHRAMLSLVGELKEEFMARPFNRIEQAVFNFLILNGLIRTPYRKLSNITGPIATLCSDEVMVNFRTENGAIYRASDDTLVPVVHMYDRHQSSRQGVLSAFDLLKEEV